MSKIEVFKSFSNSGSRNEVRMRVVNEFANELSGDGNGDLATRYIYFVEVLKDGSRIYLERPSFMHNGFDFKVCVEGVNYESNPKKRRRNAPKHSDIIEDLNKKKRENIESYNRLYDLLEAVYLCNDLQDGELYNIQFLEGYSVEHIIKVLKWLFIEQDIRYWNYSGRTMIWKNIPNKG